MPHSVINFRDKLARIDEHWSPKIVGQMNDYHLKLVKLQGEFVWHRHADTDEVFVVLEGRMVIELRESRIELGAGEMYVVPRGVEHRPVAEHECHVMLIEPAGTVNTGDAGGERTAAADEWI